jgi:hypothetical protein
MKHTPILVVVALCLAPACQTDDAHVSAQSVSAPVAARSTARKDSVPAAPIIPQGKPASAPTVAVAGSREERFTTLKKEHEDAQQAYFDLFKGAKTDEDYDKIAATAKRPDESAYMARARAILDEDPRDALGLSVILWMLPNVRTQPDRDQLLGLIEEHHMQSEQLAGVCRSLATDASSKGPAIVTKLLADSPHETVRGNACYALAQAELKDVDAAQRLKSTKNLEDLARRKESLGAERAARLETLDVPAAKLRAEALLERVVKEFPDVVAGKRTLGQNAQSDLFELRNLAVGKVAPEIEAEDLGGTTFKLSDYRGKVVMLDFWGNW